MNLIKPEFNIKILKKILEHRYSEQPELEKIKFKLLSNQMEYSKIYDLKTIAEENESLENFEKERWIKQTRNTIFNQQNIKNARVAVFGCGGIGSNVLISLAYAGVYNFKIIDFDKIELSNLNRQTLYYPNDIKKLKINQAAEQLKKINPKIIVQSYNLKVDYPLEMNILEIEESKYLNEIKIIAEIIKWADYIVCSLDYYGAPYLINDLCIKYQKPFYWGECNYFLGDMFIFLPKNNTPCLRCVFGSTHFSNQTEFLRYRTSESDYKAISLTSICIITGTFISENIIKDICEIENNNNGQYIIYDGYNMDLYKVLIKIKKNCQCSKQLNKLL